MNLVKVILLLILLLITGSAVAGQNIYSDATTGIILGQAGNNPLTIYGSNHVYVTYVYDPNGSGYVLATYHSLGTVTYSSSSGDSRSYRASGTAAQIPTTPPTGTATANYGALFTAI